MTITVSEASLRPPAAPAASDALSASMPDLESDFGPGLGMLRPAAGAARAPRTARRCVTMVVAVVVQAAFAYALVAGMGVKVQKHLEAIMMVDITPQLQEDKQVIPPPPPRFIQPRLAITLPVVPEIEIATPPAPRTTAITVAPKGTPPPPARPASESYKTVMLRYINRHLRYPPEARARHQQGVVYVRFVMNRHGHILSSAIERSSHYSSLDKEGLALLARAQPLPEPPASIPGDPLQFVVPIDFKLR